MFCRISRGGKTCGTFIRSDKLKNSDESFYNYAIKQVLLHSPRLENASIKLDGHADKAYKKSAVSYLKREVNKNGHKISKIKFVDSKKDSLIQLADLAAGSIYRSVQMNKTDSQDYINILGKRVDDIWHFK